VDLLERAVYGLPEINRGAIRGAELVAAPGCYPTTAVLPIHALARAGAIRAGTRVIVDSVSGVSGAGRSAKQANLYCEVSQRPYGVLTHRHQPEIAVHSGAEVLFTPHVGPFDRGMLSTIHVDLDDDVSAGRIAEVFDAAYGREPFVRLREHGDWPTVLGVVRTNFCDIAWAMDKTGAGGHLIVFSAIDNLVKGASGQGVQCMNLMLGLDETEGLGGARQGALLDRVREGAGAT
jgi:N-acetyl-gamma-glutamyl-phosphate reductase